MTFSEEQLRIILSALHFVASDLDIGGDSVKKERELIQEIRQFLNIKDED